MNYKKYNNTKLIIDISGGLLSFAILFIFVASGLSILLENFLSSFIENQYLKFLSFAIIAGTGSSIIFLPINFYRGFLLEHKYNLSNQTLFQWIYENLKELLISSLVGLPILLIFYFMLTYFSSLWWLPFAITLFFISVILAKVVPIFILPLFYKVTSIDDKDLKDRILFLCKGLGLKIENISKFNLSKNTKKANAAFTGLGKTKKILLADTLLENFSTDEIETVIAHELGHYKNNHIIKNIIIGTISSFLTLFLIAFIYEKSLFLFGFDSITQIAALPILTLVAMLIGIFQTPLTNLLSRKFEYEADEYALRTTMKVDAFINTLNKLTDQNLGDRSPHPFIEWFFYSHPSIEKRISFAKKIKEKYIINSNINSIENLNLV